MLKLIYKETPRPTTLYLSNRDAELSFLYSTYLSPQYATTVDRNCDLHLNSNANISQDIP